MLVGVLVEAPVVALEVAKEGVLVEVLVVVLVLVEAQGVALEVAKEEVLVVV